MIGGILFLIWFAASIFSLWYLSETGRETLMIAVGGQYFLVFGMVGVISVRKQLRQNLMILVFPAVGLGMVAAGILLYFNINVFGYDPSWFCMFMLINAFTVTGLLMLIQQAMIKAELKKCTMAVNGTVKEMLSRVTRVNDRMKVLYCPVYDVYVNGRNYSICDNKFTNDTGLTEGDTCELQINPENPDSGIFIDERTGGMNRLLLFLGILFFLTGIVVTYLYSR